MASLRTRRVLGISSQRALLEMPPSRCASRPNSRPVAARVFYRGAQLRREVGVENARVVALVGRYVVARVPLVGDAAGEKRVEQLLQADEVIRLQKVVQPCTMLREAERTPHHVIQQAPVQALPKLAVRVTEAVVGLAAASLRFADRQITGVEQQCFGGNTFATPRARIEPRPALHQRSSSSISTPRA